VFEVVGGQRQDCRVVQRTGGLGQGHVQQQLDIAVHVLRPKYSYDGAAAPRANRKLDPPVLDDPHSGGGLTAVEDHGAAFEAVLARYYTVTVDDEVNPDAAWYCPKPSPLAWRIRNHVAFWNGVRIEGEPEGERPGLFDRLPAWLGGRR
jgi:hypothetical protein